MARYGVINDGPHQVLVLGAGGAKGYLELGSLEKLDGQMNLIKIIGCSVGSIIGSLLAINIKPMSILSFSLECELFKFNDLKTMHEKKCFLNSKGINDVFCEKFVKKFGLVPTMKQLYESTGIYLRIASCDLKGSHQAFFFDYKNTPDVLINEAVFASCGIPIALPSYIYRGKTICDGALVSPLPLCGLEEGDKNIIAIFPYTTKSFRPDETPGFIEMIGISFNKVLKSLVQKDIDLCPYPVTYLILHCNEVSPIGIELIKEDIIKLFVLGLTETEKILNLGNYRDDNFTNLDGPELRSL